MSGKRLILDTINDSVSRCQKCPVLCSTRKQTVFGEGNIDSRLFIVGEAPGADEDKQGRPFIGRAGQLLNSMLAACKWDRKQVYIANILKCRPPANRVPDPTEIHNCIGYLWRQINVVEPDFILCLGSVASNTLVGLPVGEARGQWHESKGYKILCTYHPAFLLRRPDMKAVAWQDMKMLIEATGNGKVVRNQAAA